ncbi:hypothetical protein ARMGADRAFT_773933 [Armillaria gallica]|uniref:Uncharacterized protein n=1 Tax=Armillaria gallica TaxID=47427 RepID=A0A2H3D2K5_ARMGA|nr:hypothetical protein ARMGADRAFT_773933 [Armillaria gallica]
MNSIIHHKKLPACIFLGQISICSSWVKILRRFNLYLPKLSNAWSRSSVVILIQQVSDSKQFILKLNDRRLSHRHSLNIGDGKLPWTPALEERLRAAVRDIQLGTVTSWFEVVMDSMNPAQPHPDDWELDVGNIDEDDENARTPSRGECISSIAPTAASHSPWSCSSPYFFSRASSPYHRLRSWHCHRVYPKCKHRRTPGVDILRPEAEAIADRRCLPAGS